jgi:hypothetical protein
MRSKYLRCLFCGKEANTRDHIPSKNLLDEPFPLNLLTIPSCSECNKSFSLDEEYFLNVLVEISSNPTLVSKKRKGGNVYKARQRSKGLKARIENSLIEGEDGKIYFKSETDRIKRVIEKNAFGLYFHRYKKLPKLEHFRCTGIFPFSIEETRPAEIFMLTYSEKFRPKRWTNIQNNVFSYIVVRDWRRNDGLTMIFHIHNSVWCVIEIPYPNSSHVRQKKNISQLSVFDR